MKRKNKNMKVNEKNMDNKKEKHEELKARKTQYIFVLFVF